MQYCVRMSSIQIRNVPSELHLKLKARAAAEGMSLSDYLLRDLERLGERPTRKEMIARLRALQAVELGDAPALAVRADRDAG